MASLRKSAARRALPSAAGSGIGSWRRVRRVPALPPRATDLHKGAAGRVLVVAGSDGMLGAAILATTAALRGGAGLVTAALPKPLMAPLTVAVPPAMTLARTAAALAGAVPAADAIVLGPGLGRTAAAKATVQNVLQQATAPVVVDADALFLLSPLRRRARPGAPIVLTPHVGEAARLLGVDAGVVVADRQAALAQLCERSSATVVLKGEATLVGGAERWYRNATGNPGLATGGTGDVLAGLISAFLAGGMAPFDAACAAVHWHGKAADRVADRLSERGLIASDLPLAIAEVLP